MVGRLGSLRLAASITINERVANKSRLYDLTIGAHLIFLIFLLSRLLFSTQPLLVLGHDFTIEC